MLDGILAWVLCISILSIQVICNYQLFNGFASYHQELLSLSGTALQGIANIVMKESSKVKYSLWIFLFHSDFLSLLPLPAVFPSLFF